MKIEAEGCGVIVTGMNSDVVSHPGERTFVSRVFGDGHRSGNNTISPMRNARHQSFRISRNSSVGSQPQLLNSFSVTHLFPRTKNTEYIGPTRVVPDTDIGPELATSEQIHFPRFMRQPLEGGNDRDEIVRQPLPGDLLRFLRQGIPNADDSGDEDFVPVSNGCLRGEFHSALRERGEVGHCVLPQDGADCVEEGILYESNDAAAPLPRDQEVPKSDEGVPLGEAMADEAVDGGAAARSKLRENAFGVGAFRCVEKNVTTPTCNNICGNTTGECALIVKVAEPKESDNCQALPTVGGDDDTIGGVAGSGARVGLALVSPRCINNNVSRS